MGNQLHIKLLLPCAVVGVLAILIAMIFIEHLSATGLVTFLVATLSVQLIANFLFFNQQVSQRLQQLNRYMDQVISPDTAPSSPISDASQDELAGLTNKLSGFVESLAEVVADIRKESEQLRQGAGSLTSQISDSVMAVDQSSEQISQMAASIDEVASTSGALSQSASEVSETANQVLDLLSQGRQSSDNSQKTIENFAQEVTGMANDLALLQEECARIGTVLDVIRGIADQTNLLALNAAIEAARAGEQGRGFAVVADEVRALAHRTQESTVEIQSMVEGLQDKSDNAVNAITKGQALTQDSLEQSEKVVDALTQIGQVFTEVNSLTTQIASGTQEQQQATASMNDNMAAVVSLSDDINQGLNKVAEHAELQKATSEEVDTTLNRVCV